MVFFRPISVSVACACLLAGCVAPKAPVVEPALSHPEKPPNAQNPPVTKPALDDGFRTGNLLELPKESEYRPTNPSLPRSNTHAGTVIVSPPSPPSPAKPELQPEAKPDN